MALNTAFWMAYGFNAVTFLPGEALACWVLGTLLLKALSQVEFLRPSMRGPARPLSP